MKCYNSMDDDDDNFVKYTAAPDHDYRLEGGKREGGNYEGGEGELDKKQ